MAGLDFFYTFSEMLDVATEDSLLLLRLFFLVNPTFAVIGLSKEDVLDSSAI